MKAYFRPKEAFKAFIKGRGEFEKIWIKIKNIR